MQTPRQTLRAAHTETLPGPTAQVGTCLQDHQVRGVIPHIGHRSDVVDGDPKDGVLPIPPGQLDVVSRQADDCVMLLG